MDRTGQATGERRVRTLLIEPLVRRGFARPASVTKAQFEAMLDEVCAKLAYMTPENLAALEEVVAANPAGRDRDRMPIGNRIIEMAGQIQPPGDDASPLIRAVFAHGVGRDAISEGWAPELLAHLRRNRVWPGAFALTQVKATAGSAMRRMDDLERIIMRGGALTPDENDWRQRRVAVLDRCRAIAALADGVA